MTIKQELISYAKKCISGKIVSCTKHKWACMRFLNDLERAKKKDCPFVWNEDEARKIVQWFSYLRHSKGVLSGKPINLITAQKFDLCQIYGWQKRKTNLRRFNKSFTQKARKNAKSQEQAGVALYEMSYIASKNNEVNECYCAGTKREQSLKVFDEAGNMLKGSPLATKFNCCKTQITHRKSGSYLKPLANGFGVKSFQLNDMEKSTYSNITEQNKAFYSDTMQNVFTCYEQEMTYKLLSASDRKEGLFIEANADVMLRTDLLTRMQAYTTAVNGGIMQIAEARRRENLKYVPGTDRLILGNGAAIPLDDLGKQYGGETN